MTTAERIAERFGNDGMRWRDGDGVMLDEACVEEGARQDWRDGWRTGDVVALRFKDGSCITIMGDAWDIGFPECHCWRDAGHFDECSAKGARHA